MQSKVSNWLREEKGVRLRELALLILVVALIAVMAVLFTPDTSPSTPFGTSPEWQPMVFNAGQDEIDMLGSTHVFCLDGHYSMVFISEDGALESIHYFPVGSC